jgi:hypothetical protein
MLQHVCNCCDFIQSYATDSKFCAYSVFISAANLNLGFSGKRTLKNLGSRVDKKIEDYGATLLEHHKAFLDEAAVVTEVTALQILDDVGVISAKVGVISADVGRITSQLDGMTTQLKWVSSHVSDAGT